jgi:hypothetical protein
MPGFDGTGPRGMGPMTGGGRGFCSPWGIGAAFRSGMVPPYPQAPYPFYRGYAPYGSPGGVPYYGEPAYSPGMQAGQAPYPYYGGAWAAPSYGGPAVAPGATPFAPQMTREQELDFLKSQAQAAKGQLGEIEARISELEAEEG